MWRQVLHGQKSRRQSETLKCNNVVQINFIPCKIPRPADPPADLSLGACERYRARSRSESEDADHHGHIKKQPASLICRRLGGKSGITGTRILEPLDVRNQSGIQRQQHG